MTKIYSIIRTNNLKHFFQSQIDRETGIFVKVFLNMSQMISKSEYVVNTEKIEIQMIKLRLMQSKPDIFSQCNFDNLIANLKMNYQQYFIIDDDKVQIKLSKVLKEMKLQVIESELI